LPERVDVPDDCEVVSAPTALVVVVSADTALEVVE
jgi:hypothetical protein